MNKNKLFLEEIKRFVENGLSLNEACLNEWDERYGKSESFITELIQLVTNNAYIFTINDELDTIVYDLMIQHEMKKNKTFYGALVYVSEQFDLSETYVKWKVNKYRHRPVKLKFTA